ncbi:hypothetical protein [Nostoc sp.]
MSASARIVAAGIDGAIRLWTIDGKLSTIFKGHKQICGVASCL